MPNTSDHAYAGRRLVPRKEAMWRLSLGKQKWHELVLARRLPILRRGGRVYIRSDILERLIDHPEMLDHGHDGWAD